MSILNVLSYRSVDTSSNWKSVVRNKVTNQIRALFNAITSVIYTLPLLLFLSCHQLTYVGLQFPTFGMCLTVHVPWLTYLYISYLGLVNHRADCCNFQVLVFSRVLCNAPLSLFSTATSLRITFFYRHWIYILFMGVLFIQSV